VAERIRKAVMDLKIAHGASRAGSNVTLSVGVATQVPGLDAAPDDLLGLADQALYAAKRLGRNRVTSADTMLSDVAGFIATKRGRRTAQS
jgi:diguanylate cyclase (GGDEF)-like protein